MRKAKEKRGAVVSVGGDNATEKSRCGVREGTKTINIT